MSDPADTVQRHTGNGLPSVSIEDVYKDYGSTRAVDGISLHVEQGEFLTLLGPSGCGKTTTLRMIGGFEYPTAGQISINGEVMGNRPPYRRPVNTVFQNYALFPHMTVGQNIGYGLEMAGVPKKERQRRVGGEPKALPALGRTATAGGSGASAGEPPEGTPVGRAARSVGPEIAEGDATRVEGTQP
jgi:ABC-type proline/glycine betaine transport system ATPase subunit